MRDASFYANMADQMLQLARSSITEGERIGYMKLAKAWQALADEVATMKAPEAPATIVPFPDEPKGG
jgi:hypothetical protein